MSTITTCRHCGTRNRVPDQPTGRPRCASCQHDLAWIINAGDDDFAHAIDTPTLVLVDLWAPWCGPCRSLSLAIEHAAAELGGQVKVVKVNVDLAPAISERFRVRSIPLMVLMRDGAVIDTQTGAIPSHRLIEWIQSHLPPSG